MKRTALERFWAKVNKDGPIVRPDLGPCWQWTGAVSGRGYGSFYAGARFWKSAHVFAFELEHGPVPPGKEVCHACDNKLCVRHLFPGTRRENMLDAKAKGRTRNAHTGKTHCSRGHAFTPANTRVLLDGRGRGCKACAKITKAARMARLRRAA
jgi:hypothetical protein